MYRTPHFTWLKASALPTTVLLPEPKFWPNALETALEEPLPLFTALALPETKLLLRSAGRIDFLPNRLRPKKKFIP